MRENKIIHSLYNEESHIKADYLHSNAPDNYILIAVLIPTFSELEVTE